MDGVLRAEYSTKDSRLLGNSSPRSHVLVDICEEDSGKLLRVEFVSESVYAGTVKPVYYGDKAAIIYSFVKGFV